MSPKTRVQGNQRQQRRNRKPIDNAGVIPQLAKAAREVEAAVMRGRLSPSVRTKFQVIAIVMREERARLKTDPEVADADRAEAMKRLDGLAAILAKTAARDTSLIALLAPETPVTPQARALRKQMLFAGGVDLVVEDEEPDANESRALVPAEIIERQVQPIGIKARVRSSPFLAPALETLRPAGTHYSKLKEWDLLSPILRAFETGAGGGAASMELPELPRFDRISPPGLELMPHQLRFVEAIRAGQRSVLLADEPGLGKTAQSVMAASVANAYPLLVVVPNVVKANWKQEVERWTPQRRATVITGDGADVDAFADVFIINYEILDRHLGWLQKIGFRGMVVDEAHFIKNLHSQRSRLVMQLAQSIRARVPGEDPLLLALTGTPLINDVEDFKAIWQFLGWFDGDRPSSALLDALDETGLIPSDPGFLAAARRTMIDFGIVRRRKIDVAADLPAKRILDMPVELDGEEGSSIRRAEALLVRRLIARYDRMLAAAGLPPETIDPTRIRMLARQEVEEAKAATSSESIFSMLHRIGIAKSRLAAEYTAQLAHSVGKVVFFAKHKEAMDRAGEVFRAEGIQFTEIRGEQSAAAREHAIDSFQHDPKTQVVICSLMAAGVGINLQVASDVVLAELSWTAAEQTQAIDRVHRIGQEEPVTAWRILAAQTIDTHIAELIDTKQGLAARALDGTDAGESPSEDIQIAAIAEMLRQGLAAR